MSECSLTISNAPRAKNPELQRISRASHDVPHHTPEREKPQEIDAKAQWRQAVMGLEWLDRSSDRRVLVATQS
jgi:hypothetical protein